jgi:hypothetical protein
LRQTRRLELALENDGWRGNVETTIDMEFYGVDTNQTLAAMSSILGAESRTLGGASATVVSRAKSRAKSTGSRQKRAAANNKDGLNNLDSLNFLDAEEGKQEHDVDDDAFAEMGLANGVGGGQSMVSEFTEAV